MRTSRSPAVLWLTGLLVVVLGCDRRDPPPSPPNASPRIVFVLTDDTPGIELTDAQRAVFLRLLSSVEPVVPEPWRIAPSGRFDCEVEQFLLVGGQVMTADRRLAWQHPAFTQMELAFRDANAERTPDTARRMLRALDAPGNASDPN